MNHPVIVLKSHFIEFGQRYDHYAQMPVTQEIIADIDAGGPWKDAIMEELRRKRDMSSRRSRRIA